MVELSIILVLIIANGFFSGAEIAVVTARRTLLVEKAERGSRRAAAVLALRDEPERFLATVQVGITIVSSGAAAFGGASLAKPLAEYLRGFSWLAGEADALAITGVVLGVSFFSIVLGELVPKSLALRSAESYALLYAFPLRWLSFIARPLVWLLSASANVVLKPFGDSTSFTEARHSPSELMQLVGDATRAGTLHPDAGEIAARALEMPELSVADVLVPRQEVVMIPLSATPDEVQEILLEQTHSRIPVYDGSVDNIVGYISVKDVLALVWERRLVVLQDILRPPLVVVETMRAVELMRDMRQNRVPFAVVVDEYGGLAGIATLEDLLEELVGEIWSEYGDVRDDGIEITDDGSALVAGAVTVRDVNRAMALHLPDEGPYTTIAGLCNALAGRIPEEGSKLVTGNVEIFIVQSTPRRIEKVRITRDGPPSESAPLSVL